MRSGRVVAVVAMAAGGMIAATAALSQAADDPVKACAAIEKRSARLECYDRAARGEPAAPPAAGSPRSREIAPVAAQPGATAAQTFGGGEMKKTRRPQRDAASDRILVRATSVADNGTGHWRIGVEGGAVWELTQSEPNFIPPRPGQIVRIRKGKIGGYLLDVGREATVNVRRIR